MIWMIFGTNFFILQKIIFLKSPPYGASEMKAFLAKSASSVYVKSVFVIHVGGTRCVTSSTDNIMKILARMTLTVEVIRTCIFLCLLYVWIQWRVWSILTFFFNFTDFQAPPTPPTPPMHRCRVAKTPCAVVPGPRVAWHRRDSTAVVCCNGARGPRRRCCVCRNRVKRWWPWVRFFVFFVLFVLFALFIDLLTDQVQRLSRWTTRRSTGRSVFTTPPVAACCGESR
jgi:hypothetical protein